MSRRFKKNGERWEAGDGRMRMRMLRGSDYTDWAKFLKLIWSWGGKKRRIWVSEMGRVG
jgi:hypothetical protein